MCYIILDLGPEWSLAVFPNLADTQPIKTPMRVAIGPKAGFSICAKIIGNGGTHSMMNKYS